MITNGGHQDTRPPIVNTNFNKIKCFLYLNERYFQDKVVEEQMEINKSRDTYTLRVASICRIQA